MHIVMSMLKQHIVQLHPELRGSLSARLLLLGNRSACLWCRFLWGEKPWSICTQCCSKNTSCNNVNIFMCSLDFVFYFDIFSSNKVNVTVYNMADISKLIGKVMILLYTTSPVLVCRAIMTFNLATVLISHTKRGKTTIIPISLGFTCSNMMAKTSFIIPDL